MFRPLAKSVAEWGLTRPGILALAGMRVRSGTVVLAYHNIVPTGVRTVGDASLHLDVAHFREQLDALLETHDVVELSKLIEDREGSARPRAVITFDDAYRGALDLGVPELVARGLPATIFVAPALLGTQTFWWDAVWTNGHVPAAERGRLLDQDAGRSERILPRLIEDGRADPPLPDSARPATLAELLRAAAEPGISLGSHSWTHPNLRRLSAPELESELMRPLEWLREKTGIGSPWLAYPYGLAGSREAALVRHVGYAGAVRVSGGWASRRVGGVADRFNMPRLNVPAGLSLRGFRLRTAGLFCE